MQSLQSPPSTALPTESTVNLELEESLSSSGRLEKEGTPDHLNLDSRDSFLHQTLQGFNIRSFRPDVQASAPMPTPSLNAHLLRTQPLHYVSEQPPMHAHTQSYDVDYANPTFVTLAPYKFGL